MIGNFNRSYRTNRAPFGFYVHSAWFDIAPHHFPAYIKFIDYLQTLKDVYIVSCDTGLYIFFANVLYFGI